MDAIYENYRKAILNSIPQGDSNKSQTIPKPSNNGISSTSIDEQEEPTVLISHAAILSQIIDDEDLLEYEKLTESLADLDDAPTSPPERTHSKKRIRSLVQDENENKTSSVSPLPTTEDVVRTQIEDKSVSPIMFHPLKKAPCIHHHEDDTMALASFGVPIRYVFDYI